MELEGEVVRTGVLQTDTVNWKDSTSEVADPGQHLADVWLKLFSHPTTTDTLWSDLLTQLRSYLLSDLLTS